MTNEFKNKLKPDFSNIDEVYSELLIKANVNKENFTELMFIDSFNFDDYIGIENLNIKLCKISEYLIYKRKSVEWFNIDYYNHYMKTNRFGFLVIKDYKIYQENELKEAIDIYIQRFKFIYEKLSIKSEKKSLKKRQLQKLELLRSKQSDNYFKYLFKDLIKTIKSITFDENKKTTHLNIENKELNKQNNTRIFTSFKGESIFQKAKENYSNTQEYLADYSFLYHKMKRDKFINEFVKNIEFINFLGTENIIIDRIKPLNSIGKKEIRESLYNSFKTNT